MADFRATALSIHAIHPSINAPPLRLIRMKTVVARLVTLVARHVTVVARHVTVVARHVTVVARLVTHSRQVKA
jgi:hypothetical protein